MGRRHVAGLAALRERFASWRLTAVCDVDSTAAERTAALAAELLGERPAVYTELARMIEGEPSLVAADVVTETALHHPCTLTALDAGLHVLTEKPIATTVGEAREMIAAAERAQRRLGVAENYRRDPLCRLTKSILDAGVIGVPRFALDASVDAGGSMLLHGTPWRARRSRGGGFVVEQGVHLADLLLYYLGDVESIVAEVRILERRVVSTTSSDDRSWLDADAPDTAFALLRFASGATAQVTWTHASHGMALRLGTIHGSRGTLETPEPRIGASPVVHLGGGGRRLVGDDLLELVPGFSLDEVTARLFGDRARWASYAVDAARIDALLIAIELEDFSRAIEEGRDPEVDGAAGRRSLAVVCGILAAGRTGGRVTMAEVLGEELPAGSDGSGGRIPRAKSLRR